MLVFDREFGFDIIVGKPFGASKANYWASRPHHDPPQAGFPAVQILCERSVVNLGPNYLLESRGPPHGTRVPVPFRSSSLALPVVPGMRFPCKSVYWTPRSTVQDGHDHGRGRSSLLVDGCGRVRGRLDGRLYRRPRPRPS